MRWASSGVATMLVFVTAALGAGCDGVCTLVGCTPGKTMELELERLARADLAMLEGWTVEICHNETCTGGPVPSSLEPGVYSNAVYYEDDLHTTAASALVERGSEIALTAGFTGANNAFKDGDRFTARLWDGSGVLVVERVATATFEPFYPNGEDCDTKYGGSVCHTTRMQLVE